MLHLFKDLTDPVSIIMIVLGCVMFLIALLGFLGAITLKKLFLVPVGFMHDCVVERFLLLQEYNIGCLVD